MRRHVNTMSRQDKTIVQPTAMGLLVVAFTLISPGHSSLAQQSPVDVVRARNEAVEEIIEASGDEVDDDTRERLKDIINGLVDFRELSRRALGRYWEERTDQEKMDFVDVFRQLIRDSSVKKLSIYQADRVEYREPVINGDGVTVMTIAYKDRRQVEIAYTMHMVGEDWKAYDIVIDGASTVRNYRDSFYREIARTSYQQMYDRLVRRLARGT